MFEVPGSDVKAVHVNAECVKGGNPTYIRKTTNTANTPCNDPNSTTPSPANNREEEESTKVRVKQ